MAPAARPDHDQHWSLESLNKAYQQGYMAGLTGHGLNRQRPQAPVARFVFPGCIGSGGEVYFRVGQVLRPSSG